VPKGKADNELPALLPRWQKPNVALPEGYAVYRADKPEIREPPKTPEHAERLICLVEAYDDNVFRNSVALTVWSLFRVLGPKLRPWHAVVHTQRYPGDDPAQREARESDLATLTNCAVFGVEKNFFWWTILCAQDPEMTYTSNNLLGTWAIALACDMLCKEQWLALIHSDKKEVGHDLEISHLCGLSSCVSPWPFVPESHAANLARKSCHQADRCHCHQDSRWEVGSNRTIIPDAQAAWKASIRKAHGWVFQCSVCDFTVQRMADLKVRELGAKIADHYGTHLDGRDQAGVVADPKPEATEIRGRGRQQILREVPDSQSPEPEIAPTHPPARPLRQLYLSSKPLSPLLVAPRPRK
jgi:hypothetical protein